MGFLSDIFDPPETKRHRRAAMAASTLRQQAARDLHTELQVMVPFFRAAAARHQRAVSAEELELSGRRADALEAADELLQRVDRVSPELEAEIAGRQRAASSAADWEQHATFELELRTSFMQMRDAVKDHTATLMRLNREAG